jgi:hypothetical protein
MMFELSGPFITTPKQLANYENLKGTILKT